MHKIYKKSGYTEGASGREPACQEVQVRSLGWEDPLWEGMATYSSFLV